MAAKFEIWAEGYSVTSNQSGAQKMGEEWGEDFAEACQAFFAGEPPNERYYDPKRNTYWGCRLFDNETEARVSFG